MHPLHGGGVLDGELCAVDPQLQKEAADSLDELLAQSGPAWHTEHRRAARLNRGVEIAVPSAPLGPAVATDAAAGSSRLEQLRARVLSRLRHESC